LPEDKNLERIVAICNAIFGCKNILFNFSRLYDIALKNNLLQIVTPTNFFCNLKKKSLRGTTGSGFIQGKLK